MAANNGGAANAAGHGDPHAGPDSGPSGPSGPSGQANSPAGQAGGELNHHSGGAMHDWYYWWSWGECMHRVADPTGAASKIAHVLDARTPAP
jgi:hypothetical protein